MERLISSRTLAALLVLPLAAAVLYLSTDTAPASDEQAGCGRTEWVVHQAGQCLLYPVQRWERLGDIAGVRFQTCREQLTTLNDLGFYRDEAYRAAEWADAKQAGVARYWREVMGRDFCQDATRRGSQSRADASTR